MALPTLTLLDSFVRANEASIESSGNWNQFRVPENTSTSNIKVQGNTGDASVSGATGECADFWNKAIYKAHHAAAIKMTLEASEIGLNRLSLFLCVEQRAGEAGTEHSGYWLRLLREAAAGKMSATIFRFSKTTTKTELQKQTAVALAAGDLVALELFSHKLQLWTKTGAGLWTPIGASVEDTTYTEGHVGLGQREQEIRTNNFEAGEEAEAATEHLLQMLL